MEFKEFVNNIKDNVKAYLPEEYKENEVIIDQVIKNNGKTQTGLSIVTSSMITPKLYLDSFYERMVNEPDISLDEILKNIAETYLKHQKESAAKELALSGIFKKEKIVYRLVGKEANQDRLQDCPTKNELDMVKEYMLLFDKSKDETATITIRNEHLSRLGINSVDELDNIAEKNTRTLMQLTKNTLSNVIAEIAEQNNLDISMIPEDPQNDLIVVSNEVRLYGAVAILDKEFMGKICEEQNSSLVVIPSSVHECMLMPDKGVNLSDIHEIVKETNETQLNIEDRLTDNVYRFDMINHNLELAYNPLIREVLNDICNHGIDSDLLNEHYELFNNKAFMLQAVEIDNECFKLASDRLKEDKDLLSLAIMINMNKAAENLHEEVKVSEKFEFAFSYKDKDNKEYAYFKNWKESDENSNIKLYCDNELHSDNYMATNSYGEDLQAIYSGKISEYQMSDQMEEEFNLMIKNGDFEENEIDDQDYDR